MALRSRSQDLRVNHIGTYVSPIGPTTFFESATEGLRRTCDDTIGPKSIETGYRFYTQPHDLSILEVFTHYPKITAVNPFNGAQWNNIAIQTRFSGWDPRSVGFAALTGLDRSNWAWEILSKTNPSKPHVSVPTFVGELKDLPDMIRSYGTTVLQKLRKPGFKLRGIPELGGDFLAWKFAVLPMISDLLKMCKFVEAVDRRVNELMKLRTGSTIRKWCKLSESSNGHIDNPASYTMESRTYGGLSATAWATSSHTAWGTSRWQLAPGSKLPELGYFELEKLARQLATGFTTHGALETAWALCPWSWMADWFANTGDIIAATNNTIGLTWKDICYMRTSRTDVHTSNWSGDPWLLAGLSERQVTAVWTRKERYVCAPVVPFPFPKVPLLSQGHWSILAALAAQKAA